MNKKIPKILELYEDYLKSTIKLSNQIMFTLEDTKPWESKLGGCPYLEDIEQYPKGTDGGPMMFLAQINLAEMPPLPEFPHEGLLQFYVENDGCYGLYGGCVVKHISLSTSPNIRRMKQRLSMKIHTVMIMQKICLLATTAR